MTTRTLVAVAAVVLASLSACTAQQRFLAQNAIANDAPATTADAAPTPGTIDVQATCDGITVTTAGWPDGSHGLVGIPVTGGPSDAKMNQIAYYPLYPSWSTYRDAGPVFWAVDIWLPDVTIGTTENETHAGGILNCP